jgi:hypothetical protein
LKINPSGMTDEEERAEIAAFEEWRRHEESQVDEAFHIQGENDRRQRLVEQLTTEVIRLPRRTS